MPSVCFETFGVVLIESFKHATPVIARCIGPFPEIVRQSGGGELFATTEELLAAMARLQCGEASRRAMGQAGYRAYRRTGPKALSFQVLEIVERAAERRAVRGTSRDSA